MFIQSKEKIHTLKYVLRGLYKSDSEIKEFLKTFHFSLNFIPCFSRWRFLYNLKKYKTLQLKHHISYVFAVRDRFCEFKGIKEKEGHPSFLIRIDDFPHWERTLEDFKRFHQVMEEFDIPYLLGVTPCLSLDRHNPFNTDFKKIDFREAEIIKHPLIEIAMHGFSHQTNNTKKNSEFTGLREKEVTEKIEKGLEIFSRFDIKPIAFIPPFDEIDMTSYKVLSRYFKIITGGPDSAKNIGYKLSPSFFKGAVYVPYYRPSGSIAFLKKFLKDTPIRREIILPIVIHWANESANRYKDLTELMRIIKSNTLRFKEIIV